MVSLGTELSLAFWMASARVGLPSGLAPPLRAAISIARISLANSLPRLASLAPFWCLMVDHFECPLMALAPFAGRRLRQSAGGIGRLAVDATRLGGPREVDEPAVQADLAAELGVERGGEQVALADGDDPAVELGEHLDVGAGLGHPGSADERAGHRAAGELADHGGLAAGEHQPVDPVEVGEAADLDGVGADRGQRPQVLADVALVGQDTDDRGDGHHAYQPRSASRSPSGTAAMPTIGSPSPRDTLATISGFWKKVVASTIALARLAGSPDLKMPEPTNTPSAPSCIIIAASAGVAMPPAVNSTTGRPPSAATSATSS